jgi:hypothetical protein
MTISSARVVWRACRLVGLVLLLLCAASVPAAARTGPVLPLGHAGRWLTAASGRVVVLHGLNMMDKFPPYLPNVRVIGGHVTSKPDATELAIVAARSAREVSVLLSPGH